eukprot:8456373-Prorocentrum_lima.AAC.1
MAIQGALFREALRLPNAALKWVDGSQNIADALTKRIIDKTYLFKVLREASWTLVQDLAAAAAKKRKSGQTAARKEA